MCKNIRAFLNMSAMVYVVGVDMSVCVHLCLRVNKITRVYVRAHAHGFVRECLLDRPS